MIKERHIEVKNKVRNGMPYIEYSINSQTEKTDLLYISIKSCLGINNAKTICMAMILI